MTREEIIRMALEADLDPYDMCADPRIAENDLVNFANLIAAAEREACAKVLDDWKKHNWTFEDCAVAIRARGKE